MRSMSSFFKCGSKAVPVEQTANLIGIVHAEKKRVFVVGNPFVTDFFRAEEEDVVAKARDYVHIERSRGAEEGNHGTVRRKVLDSGGPNSQRNDLTAYGTGRFHLCCFSKKFWDEQAVPGTPGKKLPSSDFETVGHFPESKTPESDHVFLIIKVDCWPRVQDLPDEACREIQILGHSVR